MPTAAKTAREACQECTQLTHAYRRAAAEYSRSVGILSTRLGVLSKPDYDQIRRATEETRVASEQARLDLERHAATHGV